MKCFHCGLKILPDDKTWIIALDMPYINLTVHKDPCFKEITEIGENKYLNKNRDKIMALTAEQPKMEKTTVKRK